MLQSHPGLADLEAADCICTAIKANVLGINLNVVKKLEELEAQLAEAIALPVETTRHLILLEYIDQRFVFLKNLLSAEVKSHPQKPHHLHHIAQRLTELETVFRDWENFNTLPIDHLDTASTCSCTESCLEDDGWASPESEYHIFEDPASGFGGMVDEMAAMETVKSAPEEDMRREKGRVWIGKRGWVFMTGLVMFALVLIGVVMERFSGGGYYNGQMEVFLVPT
ncbi:hypothetical protein HHK36_000976 [Tetracentron sinense]|uniref:DUF7610 domain-containing protein n=1 Tax=Tetracentron sinense TaxID=13715 RepID=A0A834ZSG5_TETSI|nr:hypothetical protein HHK36_000976 [Tetracentron sinense]